MRNLKVKEAEVLGVSRMISIIDDGSGRGDDALLFSKEEAGDVKRGDVIYKKENDER